MFKTTAITNQGVTHAEKLMQWALTHGPYHFAPHPQYMYNVIQKLSRVNLKWAIASFVSNLKWTPCIGCHVHFLAPPLSGFITFISWEDTMWPYRKAQLSIWRDINVNKPMRTIRFEAYILFHWCSDLSL